MTCHRPLHFLGIALLAGSLIEGTLLPPHRLHSAEPHRIEQLIEQLDSSSREERLQAEKELIHMGDPILQNLPDPSARLTPAQREALTRIRTQIELASALDSLYPRTVILSGQGTLEHWLTELQQQSKNLLDLTQLNREILGQSHPLSLSEVSYWEAVSALSSAYHLTLKTPPGQLPQLTPRRPNDAPQLGTDSHSAVRIAWEEVQLIPPTESTSQSILRLRMTLTLESRLRGLYGTIRPQDCYLSNDKGENIPGVNPLATFEIPFGEGGESLSFVLDFSPPESVSLDQLQFHGKCSLEIAAGEEQFEFHDLTAKTPSLLRKGNVAVTLAPGSSEMPPSSKPCHFPLFVRYDTSGPPFESHRLWIFDNRTLIRIKHETISPSEPRYLERSPISKETVLQQGRTVGLNYDFDLNDEERKRATLIYTAPTRILTHPVTFTFPSTRIPEKCLRREDRGSTK